MQAEKKLKTFFKAGGIPDQANNRQDTEALKGLFSSLFLSACDIKINRLIFHIKVTKLISVKFKAALEHFGWSSPLKLSTLCKRKSPPGKFHGKLTW